MLPVTVQDVRGQRAAWSPASHSQMQLTRHAHRKTEPVSYGVESALVCYVWWWGAEATKVSNARGQGKLESVSCSVVSDTLRLRGPGRLLYPWDSLGKNTGVACHALLQRIFLSQGLNPGLSCLLHWQADRYLTTGTTWEAHLLLGTFRYKVQYY